MAAPSTRHIETLLPHAAAPSASNIKTFVGVARANVKTVEQVALANVKTVEGLA